MYFFKAHINVNFALLVDWGRLQVHGHGGALLETHTMQIVILVVVRLLPEPEKDLSLPNKE